MQGEQVSKESRHLSTQLKYHVDVPPFALAFLQLHKLYREKKKMYTCLYLHCTKNGVIKMLLAYKATYTVTCVYMMHGTPARLVPRDLHLLRNPAIRLRHVKAGPTQKRAKTRAPRILPDDGIYITWGRGNWRRALCTTWLLCMLASFERALARTMGTASCRTRRSLLELAKRATSRVITHLNVPAKN